MGNDTKNNIHISTKFMFVYDENSIEFKKSLEGYREVVNSTSSIGDMLASIASLIARYGTKQHIEGVGYVSEDGDMYDEHREEWCGVDVQEADVDINNVFDYEVEIYSENYEKNLYP